MPIDYLKIDRSFVAGIEDDSANSRNQVIVSASTDLAHALDMRVVAEGVETAAQLSVVRDLGCNLAQGFYFSKPLPPEESGALFCGT